MQLNDTGEGKSTGSNAIELVPSDGSGRATLDFRWTASDGLRVDVAIGNVSCAGDDDGSLTVRAKLTN